MKCVAHRVHHGAYGGRDAVERQDVRGRHDDVFGERAIAIHADDPGVATNVAVSGAALETVSAHYMPLGGDQLPGLELGDAVAYPHDFAGEFVTHHDRRLDTALGPGVPVGDVQVGPAHSGVVYRDEDLTRPGRRLGDRRHREAGGALLFDDRLHAKKGRGTRATQMMERVKPPSTWSTAPVI